jgi:predicted small lipoprotein YifL
MKTRTLLAAAAVLLGCSACGFKGPLYLPPHNGTVVTHPAPAAPPAAEHKPAAKQPGSGAAR